MPTATASKMTILFVEDAPAQACLFSQVLQMNVGDDVEITTVTDSLQATEHVEHHWVDILITDLDMPSLTALHLIERARHHNRWTQSLLLTATATAAILVDAGDIGVTDYLLKPVDTHLLVRLIHQSPNRLERWQEALTGTLLRRHELRQSREARWPR